MRSLLHLFVLAIVAAAVLPAQVTKYETRFQVRYVASGAVYISGGREEGLQEGFHLTIKRLDPGQPTLSAKTIGQVVIVAVAAHSAVAEIESPEANFETGDIAELSQADIESLRVLRTSETARNYGQIVSFTQGDPLQEELREYVPRPPLEEINRSSGRVSYEYNTIIDRASHTTTSQLGVVVRANVTRIAGSYWNFNGYWRGRVNNRNGALQNNTLRALINRTYHIGLYYNNPQSKYTIGIGRLLIPWATSVNTIDGAYLGRRIGKYWTVGGFGGSTPDPSAWDYKPGRQIGGAFLSATAGSFEKLRYSGTLGIAISRQHWNAGREYAFFENTFNVGTRLSIFHNMQMDQFHRGRFGNPTSGIHVSRSFITVRYQVADWLSINAGHNYFRNVPTFDTRLVSTGLLDQYLFTGLSAGFRMKLNRRVSLYASVGRNIRSGDTTGSLNQMYGITVQDIWSTGIRADFRHSRFRGSFGQGWYQAMSLSRQVGEGLRLQMQAGTQKVASTVGGDKYGVWTNTTLDWFLFAHYVITSGFNVYRGDIQNYDQTFVSLGYRY